MTLQNYKSIEVSKTLSDVLSKIQNTKQAVRLDFDNNVTVVLRMSEDGKINAHFIPGDKAVEEYLKNNIPYLKQRFEEQNIPYAMQLLEDCQNGAITIGTLIEKTEGEAHPAVVLLEEYCELVYQIHEGLGNHKDNNTNEAKIYKLLKQKLTKVTNSIHNDIRIRKEAVFLPYKASMWDSLESVWKTAEADPDCDAYVIPIPYYDKNPDGTFREMHYEGDQVSRLCSNYQI